MLLESYENFFIGEKVSVKKELISELFLNIFNSKSFSNILPVVNYAIHKENKLTIKKIEHEQNMFLSTIFSFVECDGYLFYGQFTKYFSSFYIFNSKYFWSK